MSTSTTCSSSATLTQTSVSTSHSLSTVTTQSVSTSLPTTLTSVITTCTPIASATTCRPTATTTTIIQPGNTTTVDVTSTINVDVFVTGLATLFGTSCSTITKPPDSSSTPSVTTPPPTVTTSSSLITDNGSTFTSIIISTYTPPPSTFLPTPTTQSDRTNSSKSSPNVGAIVGGSIAGVIVLALLAFLTFKVIKNSSRFDDFFNKDDDTNYSAPLKKDPIVYKPKPYQYGIVGQHDTNPIGISPPATPQPNPTSHSNDFGSSGATGNDTGLHNSATGNDVGAYNASSGPAEHLRNPSLTPLLVGTAAAAAGVAAGHTRPNTSSSSGRVSVSGSEVLHSGPPISHAPTPQSMGYPPQQLNANYPVSYPPAISNYAQDQDRPGLRHNASAGSNATTGSLYSTTSFGGSPGGSGSGGLPPGAAPPGMVPLISPPAVSQSNPFTQPQTQQPFPARGYRSSEQFEDPFRSGSPVSIQEQRILQVTNAEPSSFGEGSSLSTSPENRSPLVVANAGSGAASGSRVDGKGRSLNTRGEKAALVHLDGGAYQQPPPAPPAYME